MIKNNKIKFFILTLLLFQSPFIVKAADDDSDSNNDNIERFLEAAGKVVNNVAQDFQYTYKSIAEQIREAYKRGDTDEVERLKKKQEYYDGLEQQVDGMLLGVMNQGAQAFIRTQEANQTREIEREKAIVTAAASAREHGKEKRKKAKDMAEFWSNPKRLVTIGGIGCGVFAGLVGLYYTFKLGFNYFDSLIGKPTLIRESTRHGWRHSLKTFWDNTVMGKEAEEVNLSDVVLPPAMSEKMNYLADDAKNTMENGLPFRHVLFYGLPGTGKTMFAKKLAKYSGMDYAIMSGADFSQFKDGEGITELHKLFDWAENSDKGLLIFIDEADAFLRDRRVLNNEERNMVNAFLSRTGAGSEKFMLVFATNYEDELDPAVLSRVHKKINFPLPELLERRKIFDLYFGKYIINDTREIIRDNVKYELSIAVAKDITEQDIAYAVQKIEGFSGRDIEQLVSELRVSTYNKGNGILTKALLEEVVTEKVTEHKHDRAVMEQQRQRAQAKLGHTQVSETTASVGA